MNQRKKIIVNSCKLCEKKLITKPESHIIPKMFYNEIKTTGKIRMYRNPNLAVQDGLKNEYLCENCEELFSKYETNFSKTYKQIINGKRRSIECDIDFKYFTLSLFWRMLSYTLDDGKVNPAPENGGFSEEETEKMMAICDWWKQILRKEKPFNSNDVEGYILFTDSIHLLTKYSMISNNYCVDGKVIVYGEKNKWQGAYVYIIVPHLLFVCKLWGKKNILKSNNINRNRTIKSRNTNLPKEIILFCEKLMIEQNKANNLLSPKQRQKLNERCERVLIEQMKKF